jgi:hypothetical protein
MSLKKHSLRKGYAKADSRMPSPRDKAPLK